MADLSITAANFRLTASTVTQKVVAGETVTPGQTAYKLAADGEYYKALSDTAAHADAKGIFAGYADNGDTVLIATGGDVDLGATLVLGEAYFVSDNAGAVMNAAGLTTGKFSTYIGGATTTGNFKISINALGVARA